jgi:hypothetical protein
MTSLILLIAAFICGVPIGFVVGIIAGYRVARPHKPVWQDDDWPVGGWGV